MKTIIGILFALLIIGMTTAGTQHHAQGIPQTLKIRDLPWTVKMVDNFPSDDDLLGFTDTHTREILIRKGQCLREEQDTLWHEIHHAAMGEVFSVEKFDGHEVIYLLTPVEMHILRDNPRLVDYLTK